MYLFLVFSLYLLGGFSISDSLYASPTHNDSTNHIITKTIIETAVWTIDTSLAIAPATKSSLGGSLVILGPGGVAQELGTNNFGFLIKDFKIPRGHKRSYEEEITTQSWYMDTTALVLGNLRRREESGHYVMNISVFGSPMLVSIPTSAALRFCEAVMDDHFSGNTTRNTPSSPVSMANSSKVMRPTTAMRSSTKQTLSSRQLLSSEASTRPSTLLTKYTPIANPLPTNSSRDVPIHFNTTYSRTRHTSLIKQSNSYSSSMDLSATVTKNSTTCLQSIFSYTHPTHQTRTSPLSREHTLPTLLKGTSSAEQTSRIRYFEHVPVVVLQNDFPTLSLINSYYDIKSYLLGSKANGATNMAASSSGSPPNQRKTTTQDRGDAAMQSYIETIGSRPKAAMPRAVNSLDLEKWKRHEGRHSNEDEQEEGGHGVSVSVMHTTSFRTEHSLPHFNLFSIPTSFSSEPSARHLTRTQNHTPTMRSAPEDNQILTDDSLSWSWVSDKQDASDKTTSTKLEPGYPTTASHLHSTLSTRRDRTWNSTRPPIFTTLNKGNLIVTIPITTGHKCWKPASTLTPVSTSLVKPPAIVTAIITQAPESTETGKATGKEPGKREAKKIVYPVGGVVAGWFVVCGFWRLWWHTRDDIWMHRWFVI